MNVQLGGSSCIVHYGKSMSVQFDRNCDILQSCDRTYDALHLATLTDKRIWKNLIFLHL